MASPVPFRIKKGDSFSTWKAVIDGKTVDLAEATATREEALKALAALTPSPSQKTQTPKLSINPFSGTAEKTPPLQSPSSTPSTDSTSIKPQTGELRKGGLTELSPAKLIKFREQIANALATGNVSLDRALVSIFRDKVPVLPPEQYMLLSTGWELACEQYFVNGVPPAWIIILIGNAMVCTALVEKSEPKKEEMPHVRPDGNAEYKPTATNN